MSAEGGAVRIGEFSRRVGVSIELLRAWERRYGLLRPGRSAGGFRLYTAADAERVARMRRALASGVSAAEAARVALTEEPALGGGLAEGAGTRLLEAIRDYDEASVQAAIDDGLAAFGLDAVLRDLILPALGRIGSEWEAGSLDVSQEHFASNLIRGRLLALARLWGRGAGPLAVLACAPGEEHDIGLLAFGLVLRSHGWRILFLGADTPIATLARTAETTKPDLVVITCFASHRLVEEAAAVTRLTRVAPVVIGGPGATPELADALGVEALQDDLIAAVGDVARGVAPASPGPIGPLGRAGYGGGGGQRGASGRGDGGGRVGEDD